ncbi:hypothetical protein ACI3LY_004821 [Candidozyma auris]|uniref:Zn(2)-C6 fungal-type domain-containing protein n=2 Tax=Candidozyma auris TaxID=498019 RepID=A0A2H0ZVY7_CANAR|nr:hypothetical protein QG37_06258 [[Candida] auris]PIS54796.1 hypothetical protein B9J08_002576 [[Candida] auris]QWW25694.1 hypothetical protein CA7LBN_004598 [[Candida] auris]
MGYKEYQGVLQLKGSKIISKKPLKSYKRSSTGCLSCKRRKIKCDETKDRCNNCVARKLDCQWPQPPHKESSALVVQSCSNAKPVQNTFNAPKVSMTMQIDTLFLLQFAERFLPSIAQPHYTHKVSTQSLVHSVAEKSDLLRKVSIACGAFLVAFDDDNFRPIATSRYVDAITSFIKTIQRGKFDQEWVFLAIQVLQTLSLRDPDGCNASKCALHMNAAYELFIKGILQGQVKISALQRVLIENFLFNYSLTIMFCERDKIQALIPNPFDLFYSFHDVFLGLCQEDSYPQFSRLSIMAFQIAAKASWSCRMNVPLLDYEKHLHIELLHSAETCLQMSESLIPESVSVFDTLTVTKIVLLTSIILLKKIICPDLRASFVQPQINSTVAIINNANSYVIIPIWSSFIGASASTTERDRRVFIQTLQKLMARSGSHLIDRVYKFLEGLWEIYTGDEPFDLLIDTNALSKICE